MSNVAEAIDLTDDSPERKRARIAPLGAEISVDIVEVDDSDDEKMILPPDVSEKSKPAELPRHTHPRKIKAVAAERKRKLRLEKQREEAERKAAEAAARLPNFIIIDDESDEEVPTAMESDDEREDSPFSRPMAAEVAGGRNTSKRGQKRPHPSTPKPAGSGGGGGTRGFYAKNFALGLTREAAEDLQEQLFRRAAEQMRNYSQSQIPVWQLETERTGPPLFHEVETEVATRYPNHWRWKDPHSCLGVPKSASAALVKAQYRRLAKKYHPDKSRSANTVAKFHAITKAYQSLRPSS